MLTTTGSKVQFVANGTSTAFAYNFRVLDASHLVVICTVGRSRRPAVAGA